MTPPRSPTPSVSKSSRKPDSTGLAQILPQLVRLELSSICASCNSYVFSGAVGVYELDDAAARSDYIDDRPVGPHIWIAGPLGALGSLRALRALRARVAVEIYL